MTHEEITAAQIDLTAIIEGVVMRGDDPGSAETLNIDNGRIRHRPYLIAFPWSARDVAKIVQYCVQHDVRLTTKSGGHGAAGYCLNSDGIVLDLSKLVSIDAGPDESRLTVGAGARWIDVYDFIQQQRSEYVVVGGGCGTVGLGGYLLGGGYSFVSRSYGLATDSVTGMEFVTVDGQLFHLDEKRTNKAEVDLYWALRGGGGGNFGILTKVDLRLHRRPTRNLMMGQLGFPFDRMEEVLDFYNGWVPSLPNEMAIYGMVRRFPDPTRGGQLSLSLHLNPVYNGPISVGTALLKPVMEMEPNSVELYAMTLPQWENVIGNGTSIKGRCAYIRSAVIGRGGLNANISDICARNMAAAPSPESFVVWTHAGGKIRELGENCSSFAHRDGEFTFELKSIWDPSSPQSARRNIEWAVDFFDEIETHAQGAYLNYIDPLLVDWQTKYYRQSYERLVETKSHWDPTGHFDFQQGVGSDYSPNRHRPLDLSALLKT